MTQPPKKTLQQAASEVAIRKDSRANCLALPVVQLLPAKTAKKVQKLFINATTGKQKRISAALNTLQTIVNAAGEEGASLLTVPQTAKDQITSEAHRGALIAVYKAIKHPKLFPKKAAGAKEDTSLPALFSTKETLASFAKLETIHGTDAMRGFRTVLRDYAAFLSGHGEHKTHRISLIKPDGAKAYLASLPKTSVYRYRSLLRKIFMQFVQDKLLGGNPFVPAREDQDVKDKPIAHILWLCQNTGEDVEYALRGHIAKKLTRDDAVDGTSIAASAINGFATWLIANKVENLNHMTLPHLLEYRLEFLPGCDGLSAATQADYFSKVSALLHALPLVDNPALVFRQGKAVQTIAHEVGYVVRPQSTGKEKGVAVKTPRTP